MNRRRFLVSALQAMGTGLAVRKALAAGGSQNPSGAANSSSTTAPPDATKRPDLVVAKGEPRAAVSRVLDALGGMARFVPPNCVVLVKPNASFASPPEAGATTHPEVLAGVIEAVLAAGARRVIVADHAMGNSQRCFERSGIAAAVAAFPQAKLIALDDERMYEDVTIERGRALHKAAIASVAANAGLFINLPTAKAHNATQVAFGLKNHLGLIWNRNVLHNEMDIHTGIADLATVLRPQLTILDAMYALTTNGPNGPGEVERLGRVVAGIDPVAVDAFGVGLTSWNGQQLSPAHIEHIRLAAEYGLGTLDLSSLTIAELS